MALRTSETDEQTATSDRSQAYYDEKFNDLTNDLSQQERDAIPGYDRKNDGLNDHPVNAGDASGKSGDIGKNIREASDGEANPNSVNYTGSGKQEIKGTMKSKRKKGPIALLITIFFGGAVGIGGFVGGPGLLLVNLSEVMTNKFNTQLASMDSRTSKVLASKIAGTTSGTCSTVVSIMCKYSSLSDDQLKRITDPKTGITVETEGKTLVRGRAKPVSYTFTDSKGAKSVITAKEFPKFYATNPEFRASMKIAYNPKFAGFGDFIARKVFGNLKTSKKSPFKEGATDEERAQAVQEQTRSGHDSTTKKVVAGEQKDPNCKQNCATYSGPEAEAVNRAAGDIATESERVAKSGVKAGTTALEEATSVVKVTGVADNACTVYGMINAVSFGAKVIRNAQMARYAMIFLTTASMIKAGTAKADDVNFLGNALTKTTTTNSKSATDSYGYQYAAGTVSGPVDKPASQYLSGGGLGGDLASVTSTVMTVLGAGSPSAAKNTCGVLKNPFVQGASLLAGIALMIIPGAQTIEAGKIVGQVAFAAATLAATIVLPALLSDIVAGVLVDKNTAGEGAGNAIASGSSAMMGDVAAGGGNAPLTPDQAVAYQNVQNTTLAQYTSEDKLTSNQLDPTNSNTFMGKVVTKLLPYSSSFSTVGGALTSSSSLVGSTFSSLLASQTKAASASDYTQCQDYDYRDLNLATDPFCNPIRGIPPQYLNDDPNTINQRLIAKGLIDETTGNPVGSYSTFVTDCIDRTRPLGDTGVNLDESSGNECFIKDQATADLYVHYIDQRVLTGMEEGYNGGDSTSAATSTTPVSNGQVTGTLSWPVKTAANIQSITRCYIPGTFITGHLGIDIATPEGSEVDAADGGTVVWTTSDTNNYGNAITIQHGNGLFTNYFHNSQLLVKVGDKVTKGQKISLSGNTGNSFGAHLHFEISRQVSPYYPDPTNTIDPLTMLKIPAGIPFPNGSGCHG